ncbi:MAG: hypothetical protein QM725_06705 [Lacibacter sp.]
MRSLFTLLFMFVLLQSEAQIFGGNPPSLKFYQLNTDSVRIIFPKKLETQAREIAWISHQLYKNPPAQLGNKLRKFDVVLQPLTTQSNAYVSPAPWRSEFFMMPDLNYLSQSAIPWHQSLAVHEMRHIQQFSNFNQPVQKLFGVLLGQQGQVLAMGSVPDWFFEGDAVVQETVTTKQGRGRMPEFFNGYRSLWLEKKKYSYQQLRNGSYRWFTPDHYALGYLLVNYGTEKYGTDFWKKVTDDAIDYKGVFYPFQKAVKRYSGVKYETFVKEAFNWYKEKMRLDTSSSFQSMQTVTTAEKHNVSNYLYPFPQDDQSTIVLKTSYRKIPAWYKLYSDGEQRRLRTKDISAENYYSYKKGNIVYAAYAPDPRWGWKDYSVLKIWNTETNEVKKISRKSRLFMPDISADGNSVVAVEVTTDLQWSLQLLNVKDKSRTALPNPNCYTYTSPKFNGDASAVISAVSNNKGEMSLLQTDLATKEETLLFPFVNTAIGYVQVSGDTVLFTAAQKEGDVLYLYDLKNKNLFKTAQLPNGNYQANLYGDSVVWNSFSTGGRMLLKKSFKELQLQKQDAAEPLTDLYFSGKPYSIYSNLLADVQKQPGEIKRYNPAKGLLNIHSWRPVIDEPDYGITFYSENVLNTLTGEYSYFYNRNEGYNQVAGNLLYGGLYPVISLGAEQTWGRNTIVNSKTVTWNTTNIHAGLSVPLDLTGGVLYKYLTLASSYNIEKMMFTGASKNSFKDDNLNYINSSIRWSAQSPKAVQQIFPSFAHSLVLQYKRTTSGIEGSQFYFGNSFYFPGIFRNNNFVLSYSYFSRDTLRGSSFSSSFPYARGYNYINFPRAWRVSANYHFPVCYPEFGIANIVYFMRIRANLFFDYTENRSLRTGRIYPASSAGTELYFDTRIWNLFPASFGVRYSYLLRKDLVVPGMSQHQFELILPTNLF